MLCNWLSLGCKVLNLLWLELSHVGGSVNFISSSFEKYIAVEKNHRLLNRLAGHDVSSGFSVAAPLCLGNMV